VVFLTAKAIRPDSVTGFINELNSALDGGHALLPYDPTDPRSDVMLDALGVGEFTAPSTALVVATSGSTGQPKGVELSGTALMASANATHKFLGGPGHWLLATPAQHIAGVQVIVRTLVAGTYLTIMDLSDGFTADGFTLSAQESLEQPGRHYVSLVPTQLVKLLDSPAAQQVLAKFDAILLGGAAANPALLAKAADLPIVTTYGMSETSGGCVYDGQPLEGVEIALHDDEIALTGPMLATGYRNNPELTAEAFRDGWFHTGDLGQLVNGRLEVLGRADDVINTGGVKVPPVLVERAISQLDDVVDVCVFGVPDATWGAAVTAVIVGTATHDEVAKIVRDTVGKSAVPKTITLVAALPLLPSGKPDRRTLQKEFSI
jgi:O-succinylbenzoic acid--CoA ligase